MNRRKALKQLIDKLSRSPDPELDYATMLELLVFFEKLRDESFKWIGNQNEDQTAQYLWVELKLIIIELGELMRFGRSYPD